LPPAWDDTQLGEQLTAFDYLVENHYRYYQFVANLLIAAGGTYLANRLLGQSAVLGIATDAVVLIVCGVLFFASRDALAKYYSRTSSVMGLSKKGSRGEMMYNGNHHAEESGQRVSHEKAQPKPVTPKPKDDKPKEQKAVK
jgi:hypothetical protein